jgi:hypothetical protein
MRPLSKSISLQSSRSNSARRSRLELGLRLSRRFRGARTIWVVEAHRDNGKRFIVRADEKLTAFIELERVTLEANK